ncbi:MULTISPECIES: helix-turn-helix transcriptional regulator [unclassified Thiocapsa]|uniref:helix-turn-helix transcriptional regulator n=1 Tax=unclassified Thiocapsa TaxID=2641286 RepID=UPI0035B01662
MRFADDYIRPTDAAAELGCTERTLARWRSEGRGPAYTRIGARVFYRKTALTDYARAAEVQPVRSAAS